MEIKVLKDYNYKHARFRVANKDKVIVSAELGAHLISIGVAREIGGRYPTSAEFDKKLKATAPPKPVRTSKKSIKADKPKPKAQNTPKVVKQDTEQSLPE